MKDGALVALGIIGLLVIWWAIRGLVLLRRETKPQAVRLSDEVGLPDATTPPVMYPIVGSHLATQPEEARTDQRGRVPVCDFWGENRYGQIISGQRCGDPRKIMDLLIGLGFRVGSVQQIGWHY